MVDVIPEGLVLVQGANGQHGGHLALLRRTLRSMVLKGLWCRAFASGVTHEVAKFSSHKAPSMATL